MTEALHDPHQKAFSINRNPHQYGSIAEIGAGQETARWFFRVGGAAGTIAKTMSAYDMTVSDAIYGKAPRYVSRPRLQSMLELEYRQLLEQLEAKRGSDTTFFAFANTVAARSYSYKSDGQGWLGVCFQSRPQEMPSQIEIHVNLHGKTNLQDQETLGILGVNLIYGALELHTDPSALLDSLLDSVTPGQAELDMIDFSGPAFADVDNRLMALQLVERGMSDAAMFTADGVVTQVADRLWNRPVLVERSRFHPPTHFTVDLLEHARTAFRQDTDIDDEKLVLLAEMTLRDLCDEHECVDTQDFLHRADILCSLGMDVLISNYGEFYRLAQYLFRYTKQPIAIAMGLPSLHDVFDEHQAEALPGGVLGSFGRLFRQDLRLYVCPMLDESSGDIITLDQFEPGEHLHHMLAYLRENNHLKPLDSLPPELLKIYSHRVLQQLRDGDSNWEACVPANVAEMIKSKKLFGYTPQ